MSRGLGVNIRNYTAYIPEAHNVLRPEIELVAGLDAGLRSHLRLTT